MSSEFSAVSLEVGKLELNGAHFSIRVGHLSHHSPLCHLCSLHSPVDLADGILSLSCRRLLYPNWCTGRLGCGKFLIRHTKEATYD